MKMENRTKEAANPKALVRKIKNITEGFLNKKNIFAVVGVSRNPEKYGHKIYIDLKKANYRVYPVNPKIDRILGDRCYSKLEDLPVKPDVVNLVVPPKVTEKIVEDCKKIGIKKIWMQPGSESKKAIKFCNENNIKVLYGVCVMMERGKTV
jgi:predicted CoA-binding protein